MLTSYMDVNFNKYSNVSFLKFGCTVFISSKNHTQVLNRSSKAGAALVKTITSLNLLRRNPLGNRVIRTVSGQKSQDDLRAHLYLFFPS